MLLQGEKVQEQMNTAVVVFYQNAVLGDQRLFLVRSQGAAAYPENEDQQQRLREAAEGLRVATNAAAQNAIKKKLINRLEVSDAPQDFTEQVSRRAQAFFLHLLRTLPSRPPLQPRRPSLLPRTPPPPTRTRLHISSWCKAAR